MDNRQAELVHKHLDVLEERYAEIKTEMETLASEGKFDAEAAEHYELLLRLVAHEMGVVRAKLREFDPEGMKQLELPPSHNWQSFPVHKALASLACPAALVALEGSFEHDANSRKWFPKSWTPEGRFNGSAFAKLMETKLPPRLLGLSALFYGIGAVVGPPACSELRRGVDDELNYAIPFATAFAVWPAYKRSRPLLPSSVVARQGALGLIGGAIGFGVGALALSCQRAREAEYAEAVRVGQEQAH